MTAAATKCPTCETAVKIDAGIEVSDLDRNRSALFGCTCDPTTADATAAFMAKVTR